MYDRYRQLLEEFHTTSAEVSEETGIPPSTFSDWKKGKSKPKHAKIVKIADYFGVDAEWLEGVRDNCIENTNASSSMTYTMADNSMFPLICKGDILLVNKQENADDREIVLVKEENEILCRQLFQMQNGIILQAVNPDFAPLYFNMDELHDHSMTILGKVQELRRKLG